MEPFPSRPSPITTRERCSPLPSLYLGFVAKRRWGSTPHTRTNEKAWGYQGFAALISRRNTSQYCSPACASKQRNLDGFCGKKEVSAAYKRIVANLTAKDKKQKELRRQYCLDGGAVVKSREVMRQFYEENYAHQEQFRSAWEALNKAEKKAGQIVRHTNRPRPSIFPGWIVGSASPNGFTSTMTAFRKNHETRTKERQPPFLALTFSQSTVEINIVTIWIKCRSYFKSGSF